MTQKGGKQTPEHIAKRIASLKITLSRPDVIERKRKAAKEAMNRPEVKAKISGDKNPMKRLEVREKFQGDRNPAKSPEVRKKIGASNKIALNRSEVKEKLRKPKSKEHNAKNSASLKRCWQDPEYVAKQIKASHAFPNKLEKFLCKLLQKILPDQWEYVGSGDFIVEGTNKNPDFIHVNQKKIIEFNGDYWHGKEMTGRTKEEEEQQRIDLFAEEGYQTLIIWEHELVDLVGLTKKVTDFTYVEID